MRALCAQGNLGLFYCGPKFAPIYAVSVPSQDALFGEKTFCESAETDINADSPALQVKFERRENRAQVHNQKNFDIGRDFVFCGIHSVRLDALSAHFIYRSDRASEIYATRLQIL